jgi:hypothetical protein
MHLYLNPRSCQKAIRSDVPWPIKGQPASYRFESSSRASTSYQKHQQSSTQIHSSGHEDQPLIPILFSPPIPSHNKRCQPTKAPAQHQSSMVNPHSLPSPLFPFLPFSSHRPLPPTLQTTNTASSRLQSPHRNPAQQMERRDNRPSGIGGAQSAPRIRRSLLEHHHRVRPRRMGAAARSPAALRRVPNPICVVRGGGRISRRRGFARWRRTWRQRHGPDRAG